ncbi:DUF6397 family protein [Streptantibioticus silvisoli]|uniref:DUF6397 family protein n=1 Tax=Streptantibioticus silvisoli TaxID=2705255 RepID=A0ABT6W698_9ACTN|nr:DUF6397 family protein [Streptantibioticus silvisoli]MDI5966268.1 DUF6397 family protein [Streptantibioticus silvisoli]
MPRPGARVAPGGPPTAAPLAGLLPLSEARAELGLECEEFDLAVRTGEVWTVAVPGGPDASPPRVMALRAALARLTAETGYPTTLRQRLRLVGAVTGAEALSITRDRFVRLARAGCFRPARWYVNRYRAVVWLYPVDEVTAFADEHPGWLTGVLPEEVRTALADGLDLRACGWRLRTAGLLAARAPDAWHEAAVWLALLGPEQAEDLLPGAPMGRRLADACPALLPFRTGAWTDGAVPAVHLTADDPAEIAHARLCLASALARTRHLPPPPAAGADTPPGTPRVAAATPRAAIAPLTPATAPAASVSLTPAMPPPTSATPPPASAPQATPPPSITPPSAPAPQATPPPPSATAPLTPATPPPSTPSPSATAPVSPVGAPSASSPSATAPVPPATVPHVAAPPGPACSGTVTRPEQRRRWWRSLSQRTYRPQNGPGSAGTSCGGIRRLLRRTARPDRPRGRR